MNTEAHILVIEDESTLRELYRETLANAGYVVDTACDGIEALEKFDPAHTTLVLLDLVMPRMDGWETIENIRQVSDCPVIIISGQGTADNIVKGLLEAGADDYMIKPFHIRELLSRVTAILRRSVPAC